MHEPIYEELKRVARAQTLTTYAAIAPMADLDMSLAEDRNRIAVILDEISRHEHEHGRPMLSAVVVHGEGGEAAGVPGQGFFTLARDLGLQQDEDDVTFFARELGRVHDEWRQ